jgi:hypothetical protein
MILRRRKGQRGNELVEFALVVSFLVPLFLWMFIAGMGLLRMIQATQVCRDLGSLYIHGIDFSSYPAQQIAVRLSQGFGLQIGASFNGNDATNDSNAGNGWVVMSEVMFVGAGACASLPSGKTCTNQNQYVFIQRIDFGNIGLKFNGTTVKSGFGTPTATISTSGNVQNYLTDPGAVAPNFANVLQTQLVDQQVIYIAETFFGMPDLAISAFPAGGLYSRTFF